MVEYIKTKKKHIKILKEIYNYYVETSTATFHNKKLKKKEMKKILLFKDPLYNSFTIFDDKKIIGYCIISPFHKRAAYKATVSLAIYIAKDYRSKGIGKQTLDFLEKTAKGYPIRSLTALICSENESSIKLFEKNGFNKVGTFEKAGVKFDRMLDVVYYQKVIKPNYL